MLIAFLALAVLLASLSFWSRGELNAFLARHAAIDSSAAFEDYKQVVRRQMAGALVYIALGLPVMGLGIVLSATGGLGMLAVVLGANIPLLLLGMNTKALEKRVRSLPVSDPGLAGDFERVGETWERKAMPDF